MNILLVAPRYRKVYGQYYEFPLGLAYISAMLKRSGYNVFGLNLNHCNTDEQDEIKKAIKENNIQIVATGGLSAHYHKVKMIVDTVKEYDKKIITIIGGGLLSSEPQLIYEDFKLDYGVMQEGEETIVELVDAIINQKDFTKIAGIIFTSNGKTVINPLRDSIEHLDYLPFPDYEIFGVQEYLDMQKPNDDYYMYPFDNPRVLPVISTRSCPYSCTFCYHPLGKKYRVNTLDYFFEWIDLLVEKYAINMVAVLDELFSVNKERMMEFAKRIKPYNLKWIAQMRVDDVDDETLKALSESGLFYISYGIESASDEVLKSMKKKMKISKTNIALELTKKNKIGIQGNLIFGDSVETKSTYEESLEWWDMHKFYQINLGLIEPYPGTPIYLKAVAEGLIKDRLAFIQKGSSPMNLTLMTDEEYKEMSYVIRNKAATQMIMASVLKSQKISFNQLKGNLYKFTVNCPHCKEEITYSNMHKVSGGTFKLGCRNCNQRFDLLCHEAFPDDFLELSSNILKLKKLIDNKTKFALIPCTPETHLKLILQQFLKEKFTELHFEYYFDRDKVKEGSKYFDGNIINHETYDFSTIDKDIVFLLSPAISNISYDSIKAKLLSENVKEENILSLVCFE